MPWLAAAATVDLQVVLYMTCTAAGRLGYGTGVEIPEALHAGQGAEEEEEEEEGGAARSHFAFTVAPLSLAPRKQAR